MARAFTHRLAFGGLTLGAILLLGGGVASARPSQSKEAGATRASVSGARALHAGRCAMRRPRTVRARRLRRACLRRSADASRVAEPLYWGATISSQLTGEQAPWDMNAVAKFEEMTRKPVSMVQFFQPFADCSESCRPYSFPFTPLENVRQHGAIPVLSWSSQSIPSSLSEPEFQLSDLIEGRYDTYIARFAEEARDWGHPFFLRFNWEMNGNWFPWSEGVNGNAPGQYVAAWRHVHDIFTSVGAGNATWVWCPYVDPGGSMTSLGSEYPGDAYVDWTALDGYNWGTNPASPKGWKSFDQLFSSTYEEISERLAPSKPMMIGEVGSSELGGSKAAWIADMLAKLPTEYPKVRAVLWFDKFDDGMDWPIETSADCHHRVRGRNPQQPLRRRSYAGLAPGVIQPPS